MSDGLRLEDSELSAAGASLVSASYVMVNDNKSRPKAQIDSLTGIGGQVEHYLKGLSVARAALADAAKTGSESISSVMRDSAELDAFISANLASGFAVRKGKS
jgi:hypothetical protein